jgi:two-component system cell cycle sensor histidine kinase/response regulator CckA
VRRRLPSLGNRMLLVLGFMGLMPLLVGGSLTLWLIWRHTLSDLEARHLALARTVAFQVQELFNAHEVALAHMAGLMRESETPAVRDHMEALTAQGVNIAACVLVDEKGRPLEAFPPLEKFSRMDYSAGPEFLRANQTGRPAYSHVKMSMGFTEPIITVALPLGPRTVLGFIPVWHINQKIRKLASSTEIHIILADQRGVAVSHPDRLLVSQRVNISDLIPVSTALAGKEGSVSYSSGGQRWLGAATRVPELGWPLAVVEPESAALGFLRNLSALLAAALAATCLLAFVVSILTTRKLIRPIQELSSAFRKVSLGHYEEMPGPAPLREMEGLRRSFRRMASEVKEREAALKNAEERYRLVVENAQDAILVAQDGYLKFVNPRMVELLQFPEEEITSRPFTDFIHPEDREMVLDFHRRRLSGEDGLPTCYHFRVVNGSGRARWVEIRVLPIVWEQRPAALAFLTDITERLIREQALRESEERYRTLVESSPDGIFIAEIPSGKLKFVNEAICRIFGYSKDEAFQMSFLEVLPEEERNRAEALVSRFLAGTLPTDEPLSFKALRKDGSSIVVEVRVALVSYKGEEVIQVSVRDVTEHELLQRQLQHSQRMLALGTLSAGVAHEFNNILAGIQGYAELLRFTLEEGRQGFDYTREIVSSCERAGNLTRRMLTLARVEASERCPLKVNQVVEGTQRLLAQTLPCNIQVETSLTGGLPFVEADPTQLEQVLLNLALNARDAMPEGGTIRIGTGMAEVDMEFCSRYPYARPGRFVELYVEDQGVGIPSYLLDRIFEPFFTTKEPGQGTGLGLSVSYSIVKAHNGFILAQSPLGDGLQGSVFRVLLPPMEMTEAREASTQHSGPPPKGHGERILVADDETRIREVLKKALEAHGYRVESVPDGEKAFQAYSQAMEAGDAFRAVILDLAMPVKDGRWAMGHILERDPQAKIIVATGYTNEELLDGEVNKKAKAVLMKPFDTTKLLRILGDLAADRDLG